MCFILSHLADDFIQNDLLELADGTVIKVKIHQINYPLVSRAYSEHLTGFSSVIFIMARQTSPPLLSTHLSQSQPPHPPASTFISFQVHIMVYHPWLSEPTAESLPCRAHLNSVLCCLHASSASYVYYRGLSSHGLDTLLLFLYSQIDFPWYNILRDFYCHRPTDCLLCNTNTGCYHNGRGPSRVSAARSLAWPLYSCVFLRMCAP